VHTVAEKKSIVLNWQSAITGDLNLSKTQPKAPSLNRMSAAKATSGQQIQLAARSPTADQQPVGATSINSSTLSMNLNTSNNNNNNNINVSSNNLGQEQARTTSPTSWRSLANREPQLGPTSSPKRKKLATDKLDRDAQEKHQQEAEETDEQDELRSNKVS